MSYRLTKIYTRKGDDGSTSLDFKNRISKSDARIELLGTLDELNSTLGLVRTFSTREPEIIIEIQNLLFNIGGELCPPHTVVIHKAHIAELEKWIDEWNEQLPPLKEFLLPSGPPASAFCHLARTICRRAERDFVRLIEIEKNNAIDLHLNLESYKFINRLSDFLFVFARMIAKEAQAVEQMWRHK